MSMWPTDFTDYTEEVEWDSPQSGDSVLIEGGFVGDEREAFGLGLGDEHAVPGILVMAGE